jgi:ABC-type Na+ efflux pump permease subunit
MTFVNEWWLIASREYNVRIRKRSFLFFTFLGPIVFLASMVVPLFLTIDTSNKVEVIVQSNVPVVLDLPSSDFKWVYDKNNEIRLDAAVNKSFVLLNVHSKNKTIQLTDCYGLTKSQRIKL